MQPVGCTPWCSMDSSAAVFEVKKDPVHCPCSQLVALHGAPWTHLLLCLRSRRIRFVVHAASWLHSMDSSAAVFEVKLTQSTTDDETGETSASYLSISMTPLAAHTELWME